MSDFEWRFFFAGLLMATVGEVMGRWDHSFWLGLLIWFPVWVIFLILWNGDRR